MPRISPAEKIIDGIVKAWTANPSKISPVELAYLDPAGLVLEVPALKSFRNSNKKAFGGSMKHVRDTIGIIDRCGLFTNEQQPGTTETRQLDNAPERQAEKSVTAARICKEADDEAVEMTKTNQTPKQQQGAVGRQPDNVSERRADTSSARVYVNKVDHNNYDLLAEQKLITVRIAEEAAAKAVEMKTNKNPKQRP